VSNTPSTSDVEPVPRQTYENAAADAAAAAAADDDDDDDDDAVTLTQVPPFKHGTLRHGSRHWHESPENPSAH